MVASAIRYDHPTNLTALILLRRVIVFKLLISSLDRVPDFREYGQIIRSLLLVIKYGRIGLILEQVLDYIC